MNPLHNAGYHARSQHPGASGSPQTSKHKTAYFGGSRSAKLEASPPAKSASDAGALVSRTELAKRWGCSIETLKRREKAGVLNGLRLSARMVRYALEEVLRIESEASCGWGVQHG